MEANVKALEIAKSKGSKRKTKRMLTTRGKHQLNIVKTGIRKRGRPRKVR